MRNLCLILMLARAPAGRRKEGDRASRFAKGAPYSPGILVDGTLYISGLVGQDLKTKEFPATFEEEVKTTLNNVGLILKAAGMDFKDVVAVQVYLTDIELFQRMNAVYTTFFSEPRPSRTDGRSDEAGGAHGTHRDNGNGSEVGFPHRVAETQRKRREHLLGVLLGAFSATLRLRGRRSAYEPTTPTSGLLALA
jgi:2-iminobutanoate/2-iminopropanoate deaminase